jgi:hypothetical protein
MNRLRLVQDPSFGLLVDPHFDFSINPSYCLHSLMYAPFLHSHVKFLRRQPNATHFRRFFRLLFFFPSALQRRLRTMADLGKECYSPVLGLEVLWLLQLVLLVHMISIGLWDLFLSCQMSFSVGLMFSTTPSSRICRDGIEKLSKLIQKIEVAY